MIGVVPWGVKGYDLNTKEIVKPSKINPRYPAELDDLLVRALAHNEKDRIQTVEEFWEILDSCELKN